MNNKDWVGLYEYKGFSIMFSENYEVWEVQASYLSNIADEEEIQNNIDIPDFKTIAKAKKWLRDNEIDLKDKIAKHLNKVV